MKFSFGAIHLKLQNIPGTNFSSDFYMSNDVEDQDWLEPQKDGDTRLLFVDVINSPIRNYSNLLRYLEKIDVKIMSVYFEGAGIAEVSEKLYKYCYCYLKDLKMFERILSERTTIC